ncbi:MAG TPA: thioesterase family protein [Noviherbaspirillum sp.]|uniref:thioesterase family protein n=1 Tax=Noviherbaspirillum sp. TaxID=1926288 RepID=UPI002D4374A2|nr:thioesterase family protein [Noviherbaspirillum sp.]HYD93999.1 thioesterase family protein [Noviherbaspirillum sp.]
MSPDLKPGITFEWTYTVPERATVPRLYHDTGFCLDMPDVLATGYMVGMMELACVNGIMPYVDWPREQSVGVHVSFSHLAATPPGMTLRIRGEVVEVDGRRVKFRVEAWDGVDKITEGVHERVIILPEKFNARIAEKKAKLAA